MTDILNNVPKQKMFIGRWWLPSAILIGLLLLNAVLLFVPGDKLIQGARVFYWQRFNNYLYQLQRLILVVVPILATIGAIFLFRLARSSSGSLAFAFFLFLPWLFANYLSWFTSSYVTPIGTVDYKGHVYHLVRYDKYDDPSLYYLGECDQSGYWCVFHEIYEFFLMDPGPLQITVSDDPYLILVKMGNNTLYKFDGKHGHCIEDASFGTCIEAPP